MDNELSKNAAVQSIRRRLLLAVWVPVAVCVAVVVAFESEALLPGAFAVDATMQFVVQSAMEVLSIAAIPVAVRLFRFARVADAMRRGDGAKVGWGMARLLMLTVPMAANTVLYYLFMSVAFGYMAIILLISLAFVYPSEQRCQSEFAQ